MKFSLRIVLVIAALLGPTAASAAQASAAALGEQIRAVTEKHSIMGISVAAVKDGAVLWNTNFGFADFDRKIAVTDATKFRIASISKLVTATALMHLWEREKFQLDDDISKALGYPVVNPRFPDKAITFRQLLTHTSSLTDGPNYDRFLQLTYEAPDKAPNVKEILSAGGSHFNDGASFAEYAPGARYRYCNLAYGLMGTLVEKLSGERFDVYTARNILEPLGLTAHFNPAKVPDIDQLAVLYRPGTNGWNPQFDNHQGVKPQDRVGTGYTPGNNALVFSPQGGLRASALDLATFMTWLIKPEKGPRILKPATVELMLQEHWSNGEAGNAYRGRGLGFHRTRNVIGGQLWVGHSGSAYGLLSDMFFQREGGSGVVLITNGSKPGRSEREFCPMEREIIEAVWSFMQSSK